MSAAWRTRAERVADTEQIERLLDRAFGGERHLRRSELFRQGRKPIAGLCRVAEAQDASGAARLLGVVRGWEVQVGKDSDTETGKETVKETSQQSDKQTSKETGRKTGKKTGKEKVPLILAGPLAVEPSLRGQGIGKTLLAEHLAAGRRAGWRGAVLIGEPEYYRAFGFRLAAERGLFLPWHGAASLRSETMRFLALELRLGGLEGLTGAVEPVPLGKSQKPRKDTPAPKPKPRRGHEPR